MSNKTCCTVVLIEIVNANSEYLLLSSCYRKGIWNSPLADLIYIIMLLFVVLYITVWS